MFARIPQWLLKSLQSTYSRVLFDGKFHQAVAGWTVNLSRFIQICLSLSHVVVGWLFAYCYAVYEVHGVDPLLRGCPSVCPSICHTHVLSSNDWTDQVALSCEGYPQALWHYCITWSPDPPKIGVRGTSPKFTQRALPQSHLAVYIFGIV